MEYLVGCAAVRGNRGKSSFDYGLRRKDVTAGTANGRACSRRRSKNQKHHERHAATPALRKPLRAKTTEKGGVRQSIRNCLTVFQRDPLLSGAIAYNILTDRKDIIKPIGFHRESTALNDTDMKYLLLYLEETYGLTNEKKIDNAIGIVANENKYHPEPTTYALGVGRDRANLLSPAALSGADADDYTYEALKPFGCNPHELQLGCKFEIMLCLVGGQGAGKFTFFRLLAVRTRLDDLRKLDDDNVYRKLQGHWMIEMSEMMATANAKSIESSHF